MQVRDSLKEQGSITFDALWTIFPPGTIIYGHLFLKKDQIFIVEDNLRPWPLEDKISHLGLPKKWELRCWTYDFTGQVFVRKAVKLRFEQFQGKKPISSLPFCPLDAIPIQRRNTIKAKLLRSGEMFRRFCSAEDGERMFKYNGHALFDQEGLGTIQTRDPMASFK
jgi:hypothetical protein